MCAALAVAVLALRGAVTDLKAGERSRSHRPRHTIRLAATAVAVTAVMLALLSRLAGSGLWPVGILLGFALAAGLAAGVIRRP
ncbi:MULTISPECIES: hypothetical protein [Streptomyces]|uniref:hypothetical protein n=1 Tax=Streptomyces TaxID=1883 RepID=UPI002258CD58|nr:MULTISPECIES: hypothetical protein [Streptomyces]MCX4806951.1 hypothetical protein [Streptomyces sp. NBC_01214]MCX5274903.1 hypothetical protein [Streptomyces virginiae]WSQ01861.1 hypothetical protein OG444_31895 [Streptomyces sp. NBC_01232]WSR13474.1 hypothetical protein OG457_09640 [Streptomyces sp. NBC_01207]